MSDTLFTNPKLIIHTDGGARGNPGPAAIGVVIGSKKYGEYIGEATNNVAEYQAVIFALKKTKALLGRNKAKETEIVVHTDSELLARQLNRKYKVQDEDLKPLFVDVLNLVMDFKSVEFKHIPREKNKEADRLLNEVLDKL